MRFLILLALLAAGAWFAPQFAEDADGPCPALERRVAALVQAEAAKLPGGASGDPRMAGLMAAVQGVASASGGALAEAYVRERLPQLPRGVGCVVGWWKLKLDPDLGEVMRATVGR
jgi:hypothetical protein